MSYKNKYQPVLDLGEQLNIQNGNWEETPDTLRVTGTAETQWEKDQLWDKIKEIGGESPSDIQADIQVQNSEYYHKHTVQSGETLGKIAKKYYKNASKYNEIYQANSQLLKNPDTIFPGQELVIPNLS